MASDNNKDDMILKALGKLMEESELRRGKQEFDEEILDFRDTSERERIGEQSFNPLEKCQTTGFETRTREECNEVSEIECKPVMVKKIRTEIVEKCETLLDRKTCNVTYTGVPKQQCTPRTSKR